MPSHISRPISLFEKAYTAQDPHQNRRGNLRFPPQLTMRCSSIAPNPVESREPLPAPQYSRLPIGTLRSSLTSLSQVQGTQGFLSQLEKDLNSPSSMRLEARFPYHDSRACRAPPRNSNGDLNSLVQHNRLPEFPVVPREKTHTGATVREKPRDSTVIARGGPSFPAGHREQSQVLSQNST